MVSVDLEVNHKSFGKGLIVAQTGKYITVKFGATQKIFVYPDAFENFLTLADGTVPHDILADIEASKLAKQAILAKKHEENANAMKKGIVIPGKDGALTANDEDQDYKTSDSDDVI